MQAPILYTLTSGLHGGMAADPRQEPFIRGLEAALGTAFDFRGEDFGAYGQTEAPELIYVRTGGTEGIFLQKLGTHAFRKTVLLLTSGTHNSLAASMEILSWLRQRGFAGEILHGSADYIAARIRGIRGIRGAHNLDSHPATPEFDIRGEKQPLAHPDGADGSLRGEKQPLAHPDGADGGLRGEKQPLTHPGGANEGDSPMIRPYSFGLILEGKRFGVIGKPSDWLISSGVDYAAARENLGAELIDIPIEELVAEVRLTSRPETPPIPGNPPANGKGSPEITPVSGPGPKLKPLNPPRYGRKIDAVDWDGALAIYAALKALVRRYRLDGLTLRCFDLLTALHNTGCLALAILNAEGITATCEGDVPALLSMAVAQARTGSASFQANLSRIEDGRLLFAHCTVPLSIVRDYCYDTHFESGIGVAIHGELPEGPVTLFKLAPDFKRMLRLEARLSANTYGDSLCRTQVVVEAPGAEEYFLRTPIGNHHIIVPGKL